MTTGDVVYSLRFSLIKILPAGQSSVLTARLHSIWWCLGWCVELTGLAVSTLDSPAVDPRSYPDSGKILMSEKSQAVYYISSCHVLIDKVLSSD